MGLENDDVDLSKLDRGDTLPGDALPTDDTPPAGDKPTDDTPPAGDKPTDDAPPAGDKPTDTPPAGDKPAGDTPPADAPRNGDKPKRIMIPKERLDQETKKRRDVEAANEELRQRMAALEAKLNGATPPAAPPSATPPADTDPASVRGTQEWFDAQEKLYQEAVLDGKTDDAIQLRRQIRAAEQEHFERVAEERGRKAVKATEIEAEYNEAVNVLESQFPVFDTSSEQYDDLMVNAVLGARAALMKADANLTPGQALLRAAAKLGFKAEGVVFDDEVVEEVDDTPPADTPPADTPPRSQPPAARQPPRAAAPTPAGGSPAAVVKGERDLSKLTPEQLAQLRGDFL